MFFKLELQAPVGRHAQTSCVQWEFTGSQLRYDVLHLKDISICLNFLFYVFNDPSLATIRISY